MDQGNEINLQIDNYIIKHFVANQNYRDILSGKEVCKQN
jgi:hypothetical protein